MRIAARPPATARVSNLESLREGFASVVAKRPVRARSSCSSVW
ncbi:MAG: hypothetical protein R2862_11380 [Thermoanaerobaculia bacterium]